MCVVRRNGTQGCYRTPFKFIYSINREPLSSLHNRSLCLGMASQPDKKLVVSTQKATAILSSLATVGVLLRLLSRKVSDVKFWWDDALVIIALVGGLTKVV